MILLNCFKDPRTWNTKTCRKCQICFQVILQWIYSKNLKIQINESFIFFSLGIHVNNSGTLHPHPPKECLYLSTRNEIGAR